MMDVLTFVVLTSSCLWYLVYRLATDYRALDDCALDDRALDDRARDDRALEDRRLDDRLDHRALEDRRLDHRLDDRRLRVGLRVGLDGASPRRCRAGCYCLPGPS